MDPQLTSIIVPSEEIAQIEECLSRLVEDTGSDYALLLDKSGQVISSKGDGDRQDITALGALIAGVFASSREVLSSCANAIFGHRSNKGARKYFYRVDRGTMDSVYHL